MGLNRSNIFFFPVCPLFCNWLLLAECYRNVVPQVGVGGGSERCWAMEGYGEARIELSGLTEVFLKATRPSFGQGHCLLSVPHVVGHRLRD